ncbi:MAG TPA: glutaredoxin [Solirubrobacteraceae bacterium]|jgi:glutathione S-transferase|nr:glutaredoxin [Solirubrobacteraceae bacterium]
MIQLFQAEWCPYSSAVRQRLTELGVDYVARQVAPEAADRDGLREATGDDVIPALVLDDGTVLSGETREIVAALDERFAPHPWEEGHRRQARLHDG